MAIGFLRVKKISKYSGRNCVAAAAYRAAEPIHHEILNKTYNYGNKGGLIHSEIQLTKNAPERFKDRATLWNEVEKEELKWINGNTALEVMIALPRELRAEKQIELVREYVTKTFVEKGQCADWAIHLPDIKQNNPHVHIMLTVRPILEDGRWGYKTKKVYKYDANGKRIPVIDEKTGKQKIGKKGRKEWQRENVNVCRWTTKEWYRDVRHSWQEICNSYLDPEHQIDMRSKKERGENKLAQRHEGVEARHIDERFQKWKEEFNADILEPEKSEVCEYNRKVKAINSLLDKIEDIDELLKKYKWTKDRLNAIFFSKEPKYFSKEKSKYSVITDKQWENFYDHEKKRIISDMRFCFAKWIGSNKHYIEKIISKAQKNDIQKPFNQMTIKDVIEREKKNNEIKALFIMEQFDEIRKKISNLTQDEKDEINKEFKRTEEFKFLEKRMINLEEENNNRSQKQEKVNKNNIINTEKEFKIKEFD